jgi:hypothetical protein
VVPAAPVIGFDPDETFTTVVSAEQDSLVPLKRVTPYGAVPPVTVTVAVTVADCPESIAEGERASVGTPRAGLTVTRTEDEVVLDLLELETVPQ